MVPQLDAATSMRPQKQEVVDPAIRRLSAHITIARLYRRELSRPPTNREIADNPNVCQVVL